MHHRIASLWAVAVSSILIFMAVRAYGEPVGGTVDVFLADKSPRVENFRQLWKQAREEENKLRPLPEGITAKEQRQRTVDAFEQAIAAMPEAPPCPQILIRIGQLWNNTDLGGERPDLALKAYRRAMDAAVGRHEIIVEALDGQSYSYWLLKRPDKAVECLKQLMEYNIPNDADQKVKDKIARIKAEVSSHLALYLKEQAQIVTFDALGINRLARPIRIIATLHGAERTYTSAPAGFFNGKDDKAVFVGFVRDLHYDQVVLVASVDLLNKPLADIPEASKVTIPRDAVQSIQ